MKLFLRRIFTFGLSLLIIATLLDICFSRLASHSNYRCIEAWYDVMNGSTDAEVIIMGNSRAWVQINPTILDSVLQINTYNLGMDGSPLNRQIRKYNIFRQHNTKPSLIVQNIDYWSLAYEVGYEIEQFFPYFWNKDMRREYYTTEPLSFWEKTFPLYRYHGYPLSPFLKQQPKTLIKGFKSYNQDWDGTAFSQVYSIPFSVSDTTIALFDDYLAKAVADSIQIVFVYSPMYREAVKKMPDIEAMYKQYQSFADKYQIPILDYNHLYICNDTTYFMNAMHLNTYGANIYSDSLAHDLKRFLF